MADNLNLRHLSTFFSVDLIYFREGTLIYLVFQSININENSIRIHIEAEHFYPNTDLNTNMGNNPNINDSK